MSFDPQKRLGCTCLALATAWSKIFFSFFEIFIFLTFKYFRLVKLKIGVSGVFLENIFQSPKLAHNMFYMFQKVVLNVQEVFGCLQLQFRVDRKNPKKSPLRGSLRGSLLVSLEQHWMGIKKEKQNIFFYF